MNLQILRESVPASVRRFRELGLNNKTNGPKFNCKAAENFMQLCFRSLAYGVHAFDTCLLLEQVPGSTSKQNKTVNPFHKCDQDTGSEKRVEATLHVSRMGVVVMDRGSQEVLDRLAVNMIRRCRQQAARARGVSHITAPLQDRGHGRCVAGRYW
jgi:hypothetical protein